VELRHLRYFIAVAEEGSLTVAAEKRLHTAQPSLSRQVRDLELELGCDLFVRRARGVDLTAAGRVFLDHARLVLLQVEAAREAARRAARPAKGSFTIGFLTGQEVEWLPAILSVLREELPNTEVVIHSELSPVLAASLVRGRIDLAIMRREAAAPGIEYRPLIREPLIAVLPRDHALAAKHKVRPQDLSRDSLVGVPGATSPALRAVIDAYGERLGLDLTPHHYADNLSMTFSLVASTGGVALLPLYARHLLPASVVARPLAGEAPTIELVLGYNTANRSSLLRFFLTRIDELVRRASAPH
jgi:LysR family hca operon transcriptional activator